MFAAVQRGNGRTTVIGGLTSGAAAGAGVHENATVEKYFIWLAMLLRCDTLALLVMVEHRSPKMAVSLKNQAGNARKRGQSTCFIQ
jgi:hypothetical protein